VKAREVCSTLTRKSRSNFYYAFLFLPRPQREALYAVYAFCRIVDDLVDLGADPELQRRQLAHWRREVARSFEGTPEEPVTARLAEAVRAFPIPRAALEEIINGVEMDLDRSRYETFGDLYPYCYRVAGAVGLCCIEIFGYADPRARDYAVNLGVALQLTNILRDLGPDAERGRIYLPQEDLRRFGVSEEDLAVRRYSPGFAGLMEFQARRARSFYRRAWEALPRADAPRLFAAETMGRIYFALLQAIEGRGYRVFDRPVAVPARRKLAIAVRCWAAARLGAPALPPERA
jgi:phytoene synthase